MRGKPLPPPSSTWGLPFQTMLRLIRFYLLLLFAFGVALLHASVLGRVCIILSQSHPCLSHIAAGDAMFMESIMRPLPALLKITVLGCNMIYNRIPTNSSEQFSPILT